MIGMHANLGLIFYEIWIAYKYIFMYESIFLINEFFRKWQPWQWLEIWKHLCSVISPKTDVFL